MVVLAKEKKEKFIVNHGDSNQKLECVARVTFKTFEIRQRVEKKLLHHQAPPEKKGNQLAAVLFKLSFDKDRQKVQGWCKNVP